jgi:hypothetical protein
VFPLAAETEMIVWVRNTFKPQLRGTRIGPCTAGKGAQNSSVAAPRGCHNSNSRGAA